jgi:glycosyltransferase involved in cell wall biosynthesis
VIEAMALGIPVVATDVGGTREIVEHGRTGLLVPAGDAAALAEAVLQLLNDPESARRMAQAGRARVEQEFDRKRLYETTVAEYRSALCPAETRA